MIKKIKKTKPVILPILAILFVVTGTVLLIAFAQGYSFDPASRKITTTGLALIDSSPNDALISINGKNIIKKTPYRYTGLPAGDITVGLSKSQYRNWFSKQKVVAGEVTFANYALLIPEQLYQQTITTATAFSQIIQSSSLNKTLALSSDKLNIYLLNNDAESKLLYKPAVATDPAKNVVFIDGLVVSNSGDRIIFRENLASGVKQTIVLDTGDAKFDNLSLEYGFAFADLRFNPTDSNELFWLEAGVLKKVKVTEKSISSNLVSSVASLSVANDRLLVVSQPESAQLGLPASSQTQKLFSYSFSGSDEKQISQTSADTSGFQLGYIKSRYRDYITILHLGSGLLELIADPYASDSTKTKTTSYNSVKQTTVSPNSRFLVIDQLATMNTLDLEYNQQYNSQSSTTALQSWAWLDNYHLVMLQDSQLRLVDFDGQNNQLLTPIKDVSSAAISQSTKTLLPLNSAGQLFKLWLVKK